MYDKSSSLLALALIMSAGLHAALIGGVRFPSRNPSLESELSASDLWSARAVEVGTVPAEPAPKRTEPAPPGVEDARAASSRSVVPSNTSVATPKAAACAMGCESNAAPKRSAEPLPKPDPSATAGELGDTGLPRGVRHFATAFVRAVPAASYSDAAWSDLPLGPVGEVVVEIRMNAEGHIEEVTLEPETPPPVLKRMTDRAILLLKSGVFSLDQKRVSSGVERLSLQVTLSDAAIDPDEAANPRHLRGLGYEAPTRARAGYARFTLNSGREMRAVVKKMER